MYQKNKIIIWVGSLLVLVVIVFGIKNTTKQNTSSIAQTSGEQNTQTEHSLVGLQTTETPWQAETAHLKERLDQIGLPALSEEGTALHTHQHLDIFIHGKAVGIPSEIGVNEPQGFISPIHTHDTTGIIHVESPTIEKFTLGQFFDIWGVSFSQNNIGGYSSDQSSALVVFVNGQKIDGDPRKIELTTHEEIVINFGTEAEMPKIQTSYQFPEGL